MKLVCWCKLRKVNFFFNDFWMGVVNIGCDHLVYGPKNVLYLKNESINFADFFHADSETGNILHIFDF